MGTKEIIGNEGVSIINNPFLPNCITDVCIHSFRLLSGTMVFTGKVGFQNGNTTGEQKFEGKNLADVFNQIATFCTNLK